MPILFLGGSGPSPSWMDPIVPGTDLQDVRLWNMIIAALNERARATITGNGDNTDVDALHGDALNPMSAGDDLSAYTVLPAIQTVYDNLCTSFLDHRNEPAWTTQPYNEEFNGGT